MRSAIFASLSALAVLAASSAGAVEQKPCLSRAEMQGLVTVIAPAALDAVAEKCTALPAGSYLLTAGRARAEELRGLRDAAFPQARSAFMKFGGLSMKADAALFAKLPDDTLRSILETFLVAEFTSDLKPSDCNDVDRILRPLAPLPTSNLVDLMTEALIFASRKDKDIASCPGI